MKILINKDFKTIDDFRKELEDWIFGQMRVDYSSEYGRDFLDFPECDVEKHIYRISVQPECGG